MSFNVEWFKSGSKQSHNYGSFSMKIRLTCVQSRILFLFWFSSLIIQPAFAQIHVKDSSRNVEPKDSEIRSYRHRVPAYCHDNYETIKCHEKCKQHQNVSNILNGINSLEDLQKSYNQIVWTALWVDKEEQERAAKVKSLDSIPGASIPCDNKCESDPLYWSCVQDCEELDHTTLWMGRCFGGGDGNSGLNVSCNVTATQYFQDALCQDCILNATMERLQHSCEIAHMPFDGITYGKKRFNLCQMMDHCDGSPPGDLRAEIENCGTAAVDNLERMKLCVNDKIMFAQRKCCYSDAIKKITKCDKNKMGATIPNPVKCDENCMNILSPRLCREKCFKLRNETIKNCIISDCNYYYSLADTVCNHCDNSTLAYVDFERDRKCVNNCNDSATCVTACLPYGPFGTSPIPQYLIDNCHNKDYIFNFSSFVTKYPKKHYWPIEGITAGIEDNLDYTNENYKRWIAHYRLPFECPNNACQGEDTYEVPPISTTGSETLDSLCRKNPFRAIDLLACALVQEKSEQKSLHKQYVIESSSFKDCKNDLEYARTQAILYKMIFEYELKNVCQLEYCNGNKTPVNHPNVFGNMRCQIYHCQPTNKSPYCEREVDSHVIDLEDYGVCRWKADFSKWQTHRRLWSTYFNELHPAEIKHKLEYPDATRILSTAMFEEKQAYYSFPYFIIIRSICDKGYYTDESYKFVPTGRSPIVELAYRPPTNRHWPKSVFQGVFKTALINLERFDTDDENLVPENPKTKVVLQSGGEYKEIGCPNQICYPAFAAPLMFLSVPKFSLVVLDQDTVSLLSQTIYVSQFHTRVAAGRGEMYDPGERDPVSGITHGESKVPAHPGYLFPLEKSTFSVDEALNFHDDCISNDVTKSINQSEYYKRTCPELEHIMDDSDQHYKENLFAPLGPEDIFRSQYTYGTAPTQAIAGFYDPKFILIGDADMNQFEVVDWSKLLIGMEINDSLVSCVHHEFRNREHEKPIYSNLDRTDSHYPFKFYRQRYAPKPYHSTFYENGQTIADTAIFEAIGLEDRLLLVTNKGLVSFYGHSNSTVSKDKAWQYRDEETLNKCFKIVRILPAAQPNSDMIVGITYDYILKRTPHNGSSADLDDETKFKEIAQEIWVGKLVNAGEHIQWTEIKETPNYGMYLEQPVISTKRPTGWMTSTFRPDKNLGIEESIREANPRSSIEAICYKAYRTQINRYAESKDKVRLEDEKGWCSAMDATPVQLKENAIQVLVRMKTFYNKGNIALYFYILATHLLNPISNDVQWTIDSIIPRYPCIDEHREAVTHVTSFDKRYFRRFQKGSDVTEGCHEAYKDRLDFHIFLHGMTYSRTLSNHLFLYGSRLLQSTNNGRNFVFLKGFPQKFRNFASFDQDDSLHDMFGGNFKNRPVHRIVKMAFDDGGHYAFITNKLELWMGSVGSGHQIRLRPSSLQSMLQLGLSQVRSVHEGVPFTLDFDSNNQLYEMVAIVGKGGHVTKIVKRLVYEWKLLRVQTVLDRFHQLSDAMYRKRLDPQQGKISNDELQRPINYDIAKWSTFCGYVSPSLQQNFSKEHSRIQATYFPSPEQHLSVGMASQEASLLAFQAITFLLVWESYFQPPTRFYAGRDKDPYISWILNKKFDAFATMKTTLFSQEDPPDEHLVLIQPKKYKRVILTKSHSLLLRNYYIDYNITAELQLEFSIRNSLAVLNTDFEDDQINSAELNVENANGSIIQINTEKEVRAHQAAVLFIIKMSVKRKAGLRQTRPGENLIPVPVTYHLIGAFGNCIDNPSAGSIGDKIETIALVGCPPNKDLVFDWNATLHSIKLRGDRIEANKGILAHGIGKDCHHNEYVCIFARSPATLFFEVYDETKQRHVPYTGKYIMRVIGGGRERDSIRLYKPEEIDAFNIVGVSDASLIWNEWDVVKHQKVDRRSERFLNSDGEEIVRKDSRESVLTSGMSAVAWVCHTLSPCARIVPTKSFEVVFWFRIFITNRDVDSDTLCLYEKEFDVMLYGFPPSPEWQLVATLGFCFLMLGILYVVYLCSRQHAKLWVSTKVGAKNWYFIIKDAIPKKLRYYELPLPDEPEKDKPKKFRAFGQEEPGSQASISSIEMGSIDDDASASEKGSSSTLGSATNSAADASQILPTTRNFHATSKQILYDQILARRLNSIVERNRALRTNLIKKASLHKSREEFEQEFNFQKQFGRTVSQESVFTPPMPKDKNRGIDSFL